MQPRVTTVFPDRPHQHERVWSEGDCLHFQAAAQTFTPRVNVELLRKLISRFSELVENSARSFGTNELL